ncbi:hypothetical protein GV818_32355 [Pseudomonas sp. Fl4BN1]|nr:hypothetical protein [Pseudomonas sp. Fl4BN1]
MDNPLSTHAERLSFQAGDLLQAVPPARDRDDLYLLSAILHSLDDENCIRVLDNLARAAGDSSARVALLEIVVPAHKDDLASAAFDMQIFLGTPGKERTLAQWQDLFAQSAWRLEELIDLPAIGKILVLA